MEKLTQEIIKRVLEQQIIGASELELKLIFDLLGFKLKEFKTGEHSYNFEIHYKREYIIKCEARNSKLTSFNNEYVNFGDGEGNGICMPLKNVKELILVVVNLFMDRMRIQYHGVVYNEEHSIYTSDEMEALVEFASSILFQER